MAKYIFGLGIFFGTAFAELKAQALDPIQTDRPDQTESPSIVPVNYIQVESGLLVENEKEGHRNYAYPSTLWKFGVNEFFEFRLITEVISSKIYDRVNSGLNTVTTGVKIKLAGEKGILPLTSFIGHLTFPKWSSKIFRASYVAPSFRFTMQHTLSGRLSLGYNLGAEWDGETALPATIYTVTTSCTFTEKLGGYIELYGFLPQGKKPDHRADGGLTFLIAPGLLADFSGGLGISAGSPAYYGAAGISFRLNTLRNSTNTE